MTCLETDMSAVKILVEGSAGVAMGCCSFGTKSNLELLKIMEYWYTKIAARTAKTMGMSLKDECIYIQGHHGQFETCFYSTR